ncbi:DUF6098 family protein [Cellulosimicrobium sp. CUA-896]|uniref:DUF6098 family protein n=1 Tax=Cellulosimicrobium sp. CUA-896 TaxID=1517881 RepID=UPI000963D7DB|nr:DUF6098 family protein [Cellulosimicrobium sp. CUA-896]OLT53296.1 hypothetical protein BJF88_12070 [Cellulosimicrobium sp. CUA-896]
MSDQVPERMDPSLAGHPRLRSVAEVAELAGVVAPLYVRFSGGPASDAAVASRDHESGCVLPGLSVNPLTPEPWWDRPAEHWVARQLCQYAYLMTPERFPWLLTGTVVGRGPDCEPLLVDTTPVASIDPSVVAEAGRLYREVFDAGRTST